MRTLLLAFAFLFSLQAAAWDRGKVERFATLPAGAANPEGIAVDRRGNVYVGTFAVTGAPPGRLFVFDDDGDFKRELNPTGSSNLLLGVDFNHWNGDLLVVDFGNKTVLKVDPRTGAASVFTTIPGGTAAGPNAIAFDRDGNVYISDSFQGIIWRTGPEGGAPTAWVTHPLLTTAGFPPFGANGLDFNRRQDALFVANTGDDRVIRIPVSSAGVPGIPEVFTQAINGADGLIVDGDDNVWVTANQADEIVVVDPSGRAIAKLGDFDGLKHGAPDSLLFPASLARRGDWIYVTNLALDIRLFGLPQSVDSQWAADVTRHTISRLRARIPR
jgi:outer membrane protein assembly factor BamB